MQRMIEAGQEETAYKLFKNMNWQALHLGVVGGLSENLDAYPHEGESWAKLTGAYLQAWSNAEQLRVWYQYFLGIRPDLICGSLTLAPRIPQELNDLQVQVKVGSGVIEADYNVSGAEKVFNYRFKDIDVTAEIDIAPFDKLELEVAAQGGLRISSTGQKLTVTLLDGSGNTVSTVEALPSAARIAQQQESDRIFTGVEFAAPLPLDQHPVILAKRAEVVETEE
ncbi:hypothetical protein D3C73_1196240 [compost metagenome]